MYIKVSLDCVDSSVVVIVVVVCAFSLGRSG